MRIVESGSDNRASVKPLLLRRVQKPDFVPDTTANMTIVTTQGAKPEMHDQITDATAPRRD